MTFNWQRHHWVVLAVLLVCQVLGLWALESRGALAISRDTLRVPLLYLPAWVIGSAFLATLVVVSLFDVVFPKHLSRKSILGLIVFFLTCGCGGVLLWWLLR
jgi:hypothetical protein